MEQHYVPAGIVRSSSPLLIEARHVLTCGEQIEYLGRTIEPARATIISMRMEDGTPVTRANPGNLVLMQTEPPLASVTMQSIVRKKIEVP
jgi:putative protease